MEGVKLYGFSHLLDPLWLHHNPQPSFQGSRSLVNFEKEEKLDDEDYEACFLHQQGSKKRRLTTEQVQFLERNFEVENKLEPERKARLAKELGLQPRQVAIWFQNRRARFKNKQLEKDYGALKSSFDALKADYENLLQETHKLKQEINSLKSGLNPREKEEENLIVPKQHNNVIVSKNADSEHSSSLVEEAPAADADSDFSQDGEEDNNHQLMMMTLQKPLLPKVEEDECCYNDNSYSFGFPVEDQAFCFWSSY